MNFILIQVIGAIAFITLVASYYQKEKKKILFIQIIAYILFAIHYYLLSGVSGTICNVLGLLSLLSIYIMEKNN